jgi:hypothetical protein
MSELFPVSTRGSVFVTAYDVGVTVFDRFTLCDVGGETMHNRRSEAGTKVPNGRKPLEAARKGR